MRNLLLSCLGRLGFFLLFLNTAFAGNLTADLLSVLQNASPDQDIDIIIRFDGGIDVDQIGAAANSNNPIPQKRTNLINALQQASAAAQQPVQRFLARPGIRQRVANIATLWAINGLALTLKADLIPQLLNLNNVTSIQLDASILANTAAPAAAATPEWNLDAVNAPDLWALGFTGQGAVIAIVDSGADINHPDLAPSWRGGSNSWFDPYDQHPTTPVDNIGHGTQVLGAIVGGSEGGSAIGVAPDAQWIAVRLYNNAGEATYSAIHLGLQWLLDPDADPNTDDAPDVVNNSWGFVGLLNTCDGEFRDDIAALKAAEIAVLFAAGNSGPNTNTSLSPANELDSVAIGSVDQSLNIGSTSSRGPSPCGGLFPQLVAPGVNIRTSDLTFGGILPDSYTNVTGTSFAVSHATGTVALLRSVFNQVSVSDLETALTDTALDLGATGPDNNYGVGLINGLAAYNQLATLLQSSAGTLQFGAASYSVDENAVDITIEVTRSGGSSGSVTVDYRTIDDVASSVDGDFSETSGTLTFADGVVSQSFTVTINNDSVVEGDEDFYVQLSHASGGANLSSPAAAAVTIIDDEPAQPGELQLSAASYNVNEASATVTVEVIRTNGSEGTVTVDYATQDGSATAGSDYVQSTGTLTFDPGVVSQTFTVTIQDDPDIEADEDFTVQLSNVTVGSLVAPTSATVTIVDDDTHPGDLQFSATTYNVDENGASVKIDVTRTNGSDGEVTVEYTTLDDIALSSSDYDTSSGTLTFADGVLTQSFTVTINDDADVEGDESFSLQLSNPGGGAALGIPTAAMVTIIDDDTPPPQPGDLQFSAISYSVDENGVSVTIEVTRTNGSDGEVTVNYTTLDGTALSGDDFSAASGTLTFADGVLTQSFTVTISDDQDVEGNENFSLQLSNPGGGAALGAPQTATVTIIENDVLQPGTLQFAAANYSVQENAASVTLTVSRTSGSDGAVTVDYVSVNDSASAGSDFVQASATLNFADAEVSKTITISIKDDTALEGDESFRVTLSNPGAGATLGSLPSSTVKITENDFWSFSTIGSGDNNPVSAVAGPYDDADIYGWNGAVNQRLFDAISDLNLPANADIDGLAIIDQDTFYLSFNRDNGTLISGLGSVQDEDVVFYDAGDWSLFFDGSVCALDANDGYDLDAIDVINNKLYFSTDGNVTLTDLASGDDAAIYRWDGACRFTRIFDASDLPGYADIDGLSMSSETEFCISLKRDGGTFLTASLALIQDEDIACVNGGSWSLLIDASVKAGLGNSSGQDVDAFDLP